MSNDGDDEIEVEETKSKVWGAQEVNKASSKLMDDTQDDNNDLNNINITGLGIKEEAPTPKIKIKRDDTQFLVDRLRYKKEAAEALLIAHNGDLKNAVFADLGLDSLPTPPELSQARTIANNFEFKSVKYH
ncbi:hypothetical protein FO519_004371 [Halicephalobus sp. NKZ332]|nr:hypothetical protein FO519_004371 [Halicephalobus sp. NKZ332]